MFSCCFSLLFLTKLGNNLCLDDLGTVTDGLVEREKEKWGEGERERETHHTIVLLTQNRRNKEKKNSNNHKPRTMRWLSKKSV